MRNLKTFGLGVIAAMALMVFAANSAYAGGGLYNGATRLTAGATLDFSIVSGRSWTLIDTSGNSLDKCNTSTKKVGLTNAGSSTVNPTGSITVLTLEDCTFTTKTVAPGKLEFESTGGTNGNVRSDAQIEVTINTVLFGSCIYGFENGVSLGTLTTASSGTALLDTSAVAVRFGSNFACPLTAKWTATYTSTEPDNLRIEAS